MAMDMIEHESGISPGLLAGRGEEIIETIGTGTNVLNRSFLVKKMEIEFQFLPPFDTDLSAISNNVGFLIFQKTSAGTDSDTVAESFDADLENKAVHDTVIWSRPFYWTPHLLDLDPPHIAFSPEVPVWKTSKSFPKGYPLDKIETYSWKVFNNAAGAWDPTGSTVFLRVRYWGVYL